MARPAVDRLRLILDDTLRFHPLSRSLVARGIESRAGKVTAGTSTDFAKAIDQLGRAARITPSEKQRRRIEQRMRDLTARLRREDLDWDAVMADIKEAEIKKGVILKPPVSAQEKGVLLIAFEQHWVRLLRYADLDKVARDYHLVVGPTWSPPHDLPIMLAGHFWPGPLVHLLSNFDDQQVFGRLLDDSVAVPLLSSSWVDPTLFATDEPVAKEYDIVMLANFATYKRHFSFFRMLKKLPRETKVLLLGRPLRDRSEATIRYEASLAGVEDRITIKQGLPDEEMVQAMRSGKVHVIYSKNEGSCVAVAESMFADVPVALLEDANIGSRAWINEATGRFLSKMNPARDLQAMIENHESYAPRDWMISQQVDYIGSTRVLNNALKQLAARRGEPWTRDIARHTWRPNPSYTQTEIADELAPLAEQFKANYGVALRLNRADR